MQSSHSSDSIVQYSTSRGKLQRFLHRSLETCKSFWIPCALLGLVVLLGILNATLGSEEKVNHFGEPLTPSNSSERERNRNARSRFKFTDGRLIYDPKFVNDTKQNEEVAFPASEDFKYLQVDLLSILELEINSVTLNASCLSKHIRELYNLRSVKLKNVLIIGLFSRIYLPNLAKFYLHQVISPKTRLADYKELERLKSLLFFDKAKNQSWSLTKDFASLGVELEVFIDGSKVLLANETKSEIALTMSYCNDFLANIPWSYDTLILGNCTVSKKNIPSNVKSLLMGNVRIDNGTLEEVLKSMTRMESFSGSIPNLKIHLTNLPPSLRFLCLTGIRLENGGSRSRQSISPSSSRPMSQIREVAFGGDNLAPAVISQFDKIFPKVEVVGIFGMGNKSYELLYNVLKTKAKLIVIEFFPRELHPKSEIAQNVEAYLLKIGVVEEHKNFILRTAPDDPESRIGGEISESEGYFYRFNMLGWSKIDTFQKFLRVIEEGRVDDESVKIRVNSNSSINGIGGEQWPIVVPRK